ncbi:hypothetical protein V6N13_109422 [Hibiscus sabdariffa]|uniref:Uncharacterized protein n=1 Tax=Hibiscus sabdariffa TaxID=183260 RepID=A0ABR2FPG9_9ROSI
MQSRAKEASNMNCSNKHINKISKESNNKCPNTHISHTTSLYSGSKRSSMECDDVLNTQESTTEAKKQRKGKQAMTTSKKK